MDVSPSLVAPSATGPPGPTRPPLCGAWSSHAAELAEDLSGHLEMWNENPAVAAMVEDGLLTRLLPGVFLPPDLLDAAIPRVLSLGCALAGHLRGHHVVAGPTAAWVLLGGTPPQPVTLFSAAHRDVVPGVNVGHARLHAGDVETIGGAPVTTPLRTAVDLLRDRREEHARDWVPALLAAGHIHPRELSAELGRREGQPRIRAARDRLAELTDGGRRAA